MFQYTNTIVLNSLKDVTTGLNKIVKGSDNIEVRRVNKFLKSNVSAMYKRAASDPVIGKAEFTIYVVYEVIRISIRGLHIEVPYYL